MTKAEAKIAGAFPGNVPSDCHPMIRRAVEYWLSIHPAEDLPGRQHLDPVDIPDLLADLRLVDIIGDPPRFRYRIAGTRICEFFGMELTGRWYEDTLENFKGSQTEKDFLSIMETRVPNWRLGRPLFALAKDFANVERIFLPLACNGRDVDMIMSVQVFHAEAWQQG